MTSAPEDPSGLVSHADSVIDQWMATLPCQEAIAPAQLAVDAQSDCPTGGDGGGGSGGGGAEPRHMYAVFDAPLKPQLLLPAWQ